MVADGMSAGIPSLAEPFSRLARGRGTRWTALAGEAGTARGWSDTASFGSLVTDSSAASSAWATGSRVMNGVLNVLPDGRRLTPIGVLAHQAGLRVGLVTTTTIAHATPAGSAAAQARRDAEEVIAPQCMGIADVLLGGGRRFFDKALRTDTRDLLADLGAAGYRFCDSRAALAKEGAPGRLLGLFAKGHMPFVLDLRSGDSAEGGTPSLAEMTTTALSVLDRAPSGFLLQVEGGRVGHAAHSDDAATASWEMLAFDDALGVALDYAAKSRNTLVVVISDHGNSDPGLNGLGSEYGSSPKGLELLAGFKASFVTLSQRLNTGRKRAGVVSPESAGYVIRERCGLSLPGDEAATVAAIVAGSIPIDANRQHSNAAGILAEILGNYTGIGWTGMSHTADVTMVLAAGPGQEQSAGLRPNTDVFRALTTLLGVRFANPSMATETGRPSVSSSEPDPVALAILHTNDTHSHLFPFSYPDAAAQGLERQGLRGYKDIGGIARRATLVRRIREELAAKKTASWLVDAADFSDGTPFSMEYHGEADVAAMDAVGYDLGTLGNHEFNNSAAEVRTLLAQSRFQILCANVTDRTTGKPLAAPFVVKTVGALRIGVFGLMTHDAATYPAGKEAFRVDDEIESARRVAASLRGKADIIVLLSHAGEEVDQRLAAAVPEIDVIIGAHSHSRLPSDELVWHSEELQPSSVNGTVIVQAHLWGGELGRLDLLFDRDPAGRWHVERYRARLVPVTADIPEDPAVAAVVDKFWRPIAARCGEVIGQAVAEFSSRGDDLAEYNLGADALRETFGAEVGLENMGGVRAPLLRGPITRTDLVTLDPFNNTVVLFQATGRELRQILERYRPAVSGIAYRVQGRALLEATVGGHPLEDSRTYSGVTNSYFAAQALRAIPFQDTAKSRLDVLIAYIRAKGTIEPVLDGRRVVIDR